MAKVSYADLHRLLTTRGPMPNKAVVTALGLTRPTLKKLLASPDSQVRSFGNTRSNHYAVLRSIPGLENPLPVLEVDQQGAAKELGALFAVASNGYILEKIDGSIIVYAGLPPWVEDMRPQGYLGRDFSTRNVDLRLPLRLEDWSGEQMLIAIARRIHDGPGALIVGTEAFSRFIQQTHKVISENDLVVLASSADSVNAGSSAAGEFPKFTTFLNDRHVIAKFVGDESIAANARWRDLLACEHLALQTLNQLGLAAAKSMIVDRDGWRFLIVDRFDRVGEFGRVGMLSMQAIYDGYIAKSCANWAEVAGEMLRLNWLSRNDLDTIELMTAFSVAIGNTDRHFGNISFFTSEKHYTLAPAYDVLPMALQPTQNRLPETFDINLDNVPYKHWSALFSFAEVYWKKVEASELVSDPFKTIAAMTLQKFQQMQLATAGKFSNEKRG